MTLADVIAGSSRWCVEPADLRFALGGFPDCSVDAVVCDPPYGLGTREPKVDDIIAYLRGADMDTGGDFMGRDWQIPSIESWRQCYRVLKPGGHLIAFAGTRTMDLVSLGIRASGFQNRDTIAFNYGMPEVCQWVYATGFAKSRNAMRNDIMPEIEDQLRAAGVEGEIVWR